MRVYLLFGFILLITHSTFAQKQKRQHYYTQIQGIYGKPIIYSDSLGSTLETPFFAGNFRLGVQTNGEKNQDQFLGFPKYGIGLFHANLNNIDTLGNPWAAYVFFEAPIFRSGNFSLNYDAALGLGWGFSEYDSITNNQNDLIGSDITAYFSIGLMAEYRISPRVSANAGMSFIHFSNGTLQTPNKGMNLYAGNIGLSYYFQRPTTNSYKPASLKKQDFQKITKYNEMDFTYSISGKTTNKEYGRGPEYFVSSFVMDFYRRYHWVGKLGGGIDLIYDSSLKEDYTEEVSASKFMFVGVHIGHELIISKVSLIGNIGTYIYKGTPAKGSFFFRVGLKYYATKNIYANLTLKTANGFRADFIEFGLGYRLSFEK